MSEIILACSEACANAVEHPRHPRHQAVEIEAAFDGSQLALRVRDFGTWSEQPRSSLRGRGLDIIHALMDSVVVVRGSDGTELLMRRTLT